MVTKIIAERGLVVFCAAIVNKKAMIILRNEGSVG